MVQVETPRKRQPRAHDKARYQDIVREVRSLPRPMLPNLLREIAALIEQPEISAVIAQNGNAHPQLSLQEALITLSKHNLDHQDATDDEALLEAQRVMLNAIRNSELTSAMMHWSHRQAAQILGMEIDDEDDTSPLLRRAELHAAVAPPPTDEQMAQWREEYYKEKYG